MCSWLIFDQEIVALVRPASMSKPANFALKDKGVQRRAIGLQAPLEMVAKALEGIDVLLSAIAPSQQSEQIPLAKAAKQAGVKRFVPCAYATAMPVGVH